MKLTAYSVEQFIETLASKEPAPGGGSAAALLGAVGAALGTMVANLTIGREKYQDKAELAQEVLLESQMLAQDFLVLVERDTEAFNAVSAVLKMPKATDAEKALRREAMEEALKFATQVPFSTMEKAVQALKVLRKAVNNTNASAVSDLGVGAHSVMAALQGGWLNVLININGIKEEAFVEKYKAKGNKLLAEGRTLVAEICREVEKAI